MISHMFIRDHFDYFTGEVVGVQNSDALNLKVHYPLPTYAEKGKDVRWMSHSDLDKIIEQDVSGLDQFIKSIGEDLLISAGKYADRAFIPRDAISFSKAVLGRFRGKYDNQDPRLSVALVYSLLRAPDVEAIARGKQDGKVWMRADITLVPKSGESHPKLLFNGTYRRPVPVGIFVGGLSAITRYYAEDHADLAAKNAWDKEKQAHASFFKALDDYVQGFVVPALMGSNGVAHPKLEQPASV